MAGNEKRNQQHSGSSSGGRDANSSGANSSGPTNYRSPRTNTHTSNHPLQQMWSRNLADVIKLAELELDKLGKFYAFNFDFLLLKH